jgi:hypothetical protein
MTTTDHEATEHHEGERTIHFTVDGETLTTEEEVLTPAEIMQLAKIDPATHFVTEIKGKEQISFEGKPNEEIEMLMNMVFISSSTGPTGVS